MEFKHKSVLLNETVDGLNIKPDGIYRWNARWRRTCIRGVQTSQEKREYCRNRPGRCSNRAASARLKDFGRRLQ